MTNKVEFVVEIYDTGGDVVTKRTYKTIAEVQQFLKIAIPDLMGAPTRGYQIAIVQTLILAERQL